MICRSFKSELKLQYATKKFNTQSTGLSGWERGTINEKEKKRQHQKERSEKPDEKWDVKCGNRKIRKKGTEEATEEVHIKLQYVTRVELREVESRSGWAAC